MNVLFKATSDEIVFTTVSQEKNNIYAKQTVYCMFISQVEDNWQWLPEQMVNINFKRIDFYQYSRSED